MCPLLKEYSHLKLVDPEFRFYIWPQHNQDYYNTISFSQLELLILAPSPVSRVNVIALQKIYEYLCSIEEICTAHFFFKETPKLYFTLKLEFSKNLESVSDHLRPQSENTVSSKHFVKSTQASNSVLSMEILLEIKAIFYVFNLYNEILVLYMNLITSGKDQIM